MLETVTGMYAASMAKDVFEIEVLRTNTSRCMGLQKDFVDGYCVPRWDLTFLSPDSKTLFAT